MAQTIDPPASAGPAVSLNQTPTLLETLAGQVDLSSAPMIRGRSLPPVVEREDAEKPPGSEKPKEEPKPKEDPKPKAKEGEKSETELDEEFKKAGETIAERMFRKKTPPKEDPKGGGGKPAEPDSKKTDAEKKDVKPTDEPKPKSRRRLSEAELTERATAAATEAATRAVAGMAAKQPAAAPSKTKSDDPREALQPDERKQFDTYRELEQLYPDRYKGVTDRFVKSLAEMEDYIKTWAKEHPGEAFDPDDEQHSAFFSRIEPEVDEDDWVDAKANIRAREIADRAVAPVNEKLQKMERDQARAMIEPYLRQKSLESVGMMLEHFDPELAKELNTPEGLKALGERDPITHSILGSMSNMLGALTAELIRLHDPMGGVNYDPKNDLHREIAEFIVEQEHRIARLPVNDREREGKTFIGRLQYSQLPPEDKGRYWFLSEDDVMYLLAQKYAQSAKKTRDAEIAKFNKTAERLGYKKIDAPKNEPTKGKVDTEKPAKTRETTPSPEGVLKSTVRTTGQPAAKPIDDAATAIVGALFPRLKS